MHVVLLAHGSRDPRHAEFVERIATGVAAQGGPESVRAAYLDLCPPGLSTAVAGLPGAATVAVVPLLLTSAFHARVDVPGALAEAEAARPDLDVRATEVLGTDPLLDSALTRRAGAAGLDLDDPGVAALVVAAGSSDPTARAEIAAVVTRWTAGGHPRAHAFASGEGPAVEQAVTDLIDRGAHDVVLVPYLLAPGRLLDSAVSTARAVAADRSARLVVADVLGDAPEVLELITQRLAAAGS